MASFNSGSSRAIGFRSGECKRPIKKFKILQLEHSCRYVIDVVDPTQCTVQAINITTGALTGPVESLNGTLEVIFSDSPTPPPNPFNPADAALNGDEDVNLPPSLPLSIVPGSVAIIGPTRPINFVDPVRTWTGGQGARLISVAGTKITIETISFVINNGAGWVIHNGQELAVRISYNIRNNCGSIDDNTNLGLVGVAASTTTNISMFVGQGQEFNPVPRIVVDMNYSLPPDTNLPPVLDAGWYVMAFETYSVLDNFWIELKATATNLDYWRDTDGDGIPDTASKIYWGRIGPLGDDDGFAAPVANILTGANINTYFPSNVAPAQTGGADEGQGYFCAYKPPGFEFHVKLNVFNNEGSGLRVGAAKLYKPNTPEVLFNKYPGFSRYSNRTLVSNGGIVATSDSTVGLGNLTGFTRYQLELRFTWTSRVANTSIRLEIRDSGGTVLSRSLGENDSGVLEPVRYTATAATHNDAAFYRISFNNNNATTNNVVLHITALDNTGAPTTIAAVGAVNGGTVSYSLYTATLGYDYTYATADVLTTRATLGVGYPNPTRYYTPTTSTTWANRDQLEIGAFAGQTILDHSGNPYTWQAVSGWVFSDDTTRLCLISDTQPNPDRYFLDPNVRPTDAEVRECFANLRLANPGRSGFPQGAATMNDCPIGYRLDNTTGYSADEVFGTGMAGATNSVDRTPWSVWPQTGQDWPNVWPWPAEVLGPAGAAVVPALQASTTTGSFTPDFGSRTIRVAPVTAAGVPNANGFGRQQSS